MVMANRMMINAASDRTALVRALFRPQYYIDGRDLTSDDKQTMPDLMGDAPSIIGSNTNAESLDPRVLPHDGEDYVYFHATNTNGLFKAGAAETLPFTVTVKLFYSGPLGATGGIISRYLTAGNQRAWSVYISATGAIGVYQSSNGTSFSNNGTATTLSSAGYDNKMIWIKCAFAVSGSNTIMTVTVSTDGVVFDSFEAVSLSVNTLHASTGPLTVGARYCTNATSPYGSFEVTRYRIFGAWINDVQVMDPSDLTGWTIDRTLSSYPTTVVTSPCFVTDGTNDIVTVPASLIPTYVTPSTGEWTGVILTRTWPNGPTTQALFSTGNGPYEGLSLYESGGTTLVATARDSGSGAVNPSVGVVGGTGTLKVTALIKGAGTIQTYSSNRGASSIPSTLSLSDINFGTHFKLSNSWGNANNSAGRRGEYFAFLTFTRALSVAELDTLSAILMHGR